MRYSIISLLSCLLFLTACNTTPATKKITKRKAVNQITTGRYGDLLVAYDGQQLTGMYQQVGGGGQFSCAFYFQGKSTNPLKPIPINWYYPEESEKKSGILLFQDSSLKLQIQGNPGGQCSPALMKKGEIISLTAKDSWTAIHVVQTDQAVIYEEADSTMPTGSKIRKGNVIGTLQQKGEWFRFEETVKNGKMGWIKASDLYPLL